MTRLITTGIRGLDDVLLGGWPAERMYLVIGHPGTGKTTLGLQFLVAGVARGESVLYLSLSETKSEIDQVAASHGWTLEGITTYELTAAEHDLGLADAQTMFDPTDVEFRRTTSTLLDHVERQRPSRVVFDSLSELALLAREPLAFRREILLLKRAFMEAGSTVLLLSDSTTHEADLQLQSLAHGVLVLEELAPEYGPERRRMRLRKLRGRTYLGGYHDYRIERGGLAVFPRLVASAHDESDDGEPVRTEVPGLDALTGGGLAMGTSTLIMGPAGAGKSTLVTQYALGVLERGQRAALYLFDESREIFLRRARGLGQHLDRYLESGALTMIQIDPAAMSPGEFAHTVRHGVENEGARFVAIDSLNGYTFAMPEERFLNLHVHELLSYLGQRGVASALVLAQSGLLGSMTSHADVTYLADAVINIRFFEDNGVVRRAISMFKKRDGRHETSIRELSTTGGRLVVSEPLESFQGVLTGVPRPARSPERRPHAGS